MDSYSFEELARIIKLSVLDSGLRAVLTINSEVELDKSITVDVLKTFLENKKISYGIDEELLQSFCDSTSEYIGKEVEVAKGVESINGEDGYIVWEIENDVSSEPEVLENGSVDYHTLNRVSNIEKGQLIARKVSSTMAVPGVNVYNTEIKGKNGKEYKFKIGKNVILNEEKDKVYANLSGQLVMTEREKINVFPLYEVRGDLGFDVGNIDFVGTVIIKGNVPDGFKIVAAGEIKVYGNVEAAELIAGGDIFIQQGIIGHKKAVVETKRSLTASFILDADVRANEDVNVTKSIMHSNVYAGAKVDCSRGKGIIVGGITQAADSIVANVIGNDLNTVTAVEVGINPLIRQEMNEIRKEKKSLNESMLKIINGLELFEKMKKVEGSLPEKKVELQNQLIRQKLSINKKLFEMGNREKEIEEELDRIDNSFIKVNQIIFPGSKIVIGKSVKFIKEEIKFAKFVEEDNMIKIIK